MMSESIKVKNENAGNHEIQCDCNFCFCWTFYYFGTFSGFIKRRSREKLDKSLKILSRRDADLPILRYRGLHREGVAMNSQDIQNEMERQRLILHQLADEFGFLDERVLVQSQKLDEWLNEYERHKNN